MSNKFKIKIITRLQDNGDGGYTLYGYNNEEEMLADHPANDGEMSEEKKREILTEYDPYGNGYLGSGTIEVEVDENGVAKLTKSLSFHAGQ